MKNCIAYRQQGFSLVELMVGMVLGLFLAMGVAQVFVSNNATFRSQEGLAKIQEGGRFAMNRLSSSIRLAGFFGCSGLSRVEKYAETNVLATNLQSGTQLESITPRKAVFGQDNVTSGTEISGKTLVTGSDTLTLRGSGMEGVSYTGTEVTAFDDITINDPNIVIADGDYVVISDCQTITAVRATEDTDSTLVKHAVTSGGDSYNSTDSLKYKFGPDAVVTLPFVDTFYVADTGRTNYKGDSVMALYFQDINGNNHELVEGVSRFQVMYGVDADENYEAERYVTAAQITGSIDWDDVISIRISMLIDSVDDAVATPADYTFMGAAYTPSDRRLRKEFTALYTLRSKALGEF